MIFKFTITLARRQAKAPILVGLEENNEKHSSEILALRIKRQLPCVTLCS